MLELLGLLDGIRSQSLQLFSIEGRKAGINSGRQMLAIDRMLSRESRKLKPEAGHCSAEELDAIVEWAKPISA